MLLPLIPSLSTHIPYKNAITDATIFHVRCQLLMILSEKNLMLLLLQSIETHKIIMALLIALPKLVPFFSWNKSAKIQFKYVGIIIQSISRFVNGAANRDPHILRSSQKYKAIAVSIAGILILPNV